MSAAVSVGGPPGDIWTLGDAWLRRSLEVVSESAEALNALNVFPVFDSDTGTNVELTLAGIVTAVDRFDRANLDVVVQAAILSAHGNSGAIIAEMVIGVCRAVERLAAELHQASGLDRVPPGAVVGGVLATIAAAATRAVAEPVEGTILTVADAAAVGAVAAAEAAPDDALLVARAGRAAGSVALERTRDQLSVLRDAGVVDAGGQAFVLLLEVLVEVLGGERAEPLTTVPGAVRPSPAATPSPVALEYEVMYVLTDAGPDGLAALRGRLSALGNSVVVVGDAVAAQVHVHLTEAGEAIEAGLGYGSMSRIRVTALPPTGDARRAEPAGRTVLSVVAGPGLAAVVRSLGGVPVLADATQSRRVSAAELTRALADTTGDLVILPNGRDALALCAQLAQSVRGSGRRVAVVPTLAQVQGLAALAVHEPAADFDSMVAAMSNAAGHARHGAVTVAERPAMTMAGPCETGDVLGLVEGDFVEIGSSVVDVAWRVIERLLATGGGEILTLVGGRTDQPELLVELVGRARSARGASLDIEVIDGGQSRYPVLMGLECRGS